MYGSLSLQARREKPAAHLRFLSLGFFPWVDDNPRLIASVSVPLTTLSESIGLVTQRVMSSWAMVVGATEKRRTSGHVLFSLNTTVFIPVVVSPVVLALLLSFLIGFTSDYDTLLNYEWTCGRALLPSISRIINLPKERTFCNLLVLFHIGLRPLLSAHYYAICRIPADKLKYPKLFVILTSLIPISSLFELGFTAALTLIGERENPSLHVIFFCGFCVSANLYFMLVTVLFRISRHYATTTNARRSFLLKAFLVTTSLLLLPSLSIFFVLYWKFCVKFAYNIFALLEYATVFTMLSYHFTAYLDFNYSYQFVVAK
uniref:Post-GPI attachment to proteins factor 2-like n=1 Tax=Steinernema glaseri TaxID=37863 RepID=A0A1I7YE85_9BILA